MSKTSRILHLLITVSSDRGKYSHLNNKIGKGFDQLYLDRQHGRLVFRKEGKVRYSVGGVDEFIGDEGRNDAHRRYRLVSTAATTHNHHQPPRLVPPPRDRLMVGEHITTYIIQNCTFNYSLRIAAGLAGARKLLTGEGKCVFVICFIVVGNSCVLQGGQKNYPTEVNVI